jgi:sugar/nucleoside kinase (ribokinase family)
VVVGSVSVDRIRTPGCIDERTVGGAGLYAALAAAATGAAVGMVGLLSDHRLVDDIIWPDLLEHDGLLRVPGRRLHFDIRYDKRGRATYLVDGADAEELVSFSALPERYTRVGAFHLCPTGPVLTQLRFAQRLRADPRTASATLTATTFRARIESSPTAVYRLWGLTDGFICNAEEACLLTATTRLAQAITAIGRHLATQSRSTVTFVTNGGFGCEVITVGGHWHIPARHVVVVDPTGAGEAFAGALAAARAGGAGWLDAARYAVAVASLAVTDVGPRALLAAASGTDPRHPTQPVKSLVEGR